MRGLDLVEGSGPEKWSARQQLYSFGTGVELEDRGGTVEPGRTVLA